MHVYANRATLVDLMSCYDLALEAISAASSAAATAVASTHEGKKGTGAGVTATLYPSLLKSLDND